MVFVDLWSTALDLDEGLVEEFAAALSSDERARARRFVFARDRRRFVVGRAFLRAVLARQLGVAVGQVRFRYGAEGKPELEDPAGDLRFNLAHSDALAVCAVTRQREVGVDVERLRPLPDAEEVARRFFSPRENAELAALPPQRRVRAFYDAWTRKEAFLKALGSGLARPLDGFDVSLAPGAPARLLRTLDDPDEAARYALRAFEPVRGYVGAVAVEAREIALRCLVWSWTPVQLAEVGA